MAVDKRRLDWEWTANFFFSTDSSKSMLVAKSPKKGEGPLPKPAFVTQRVHNSNKSGKQEALQVTNKMPLSHDLAFCLSTSHFNQHPSKYLQTSFLDLHTSTRNPLHFGIKISILLSC